MELNSKSMQVIRIPTALNSELFDYWFHFMQPFHNLTDREMEVAGQYAWKRYQLLKREPDPDIVDEAMQKEDIRAQIREAAGVTPAHYQVILGKFRKAKVLIGNKFNPRFMPSIVEEEGTFKLLLVFDFRNH